jgi:uncharacterized protein YjdB
MSRATKRHLVSLAVAACLFPTACDNPGDAVGPGENPDNIQFSLSPARITLKIGETAIISPTVNNANGRPANPRSLKWESTNATVADVDRDGKVTGLAAGDARIVARSGSAADTTTVRVLDMQVSRVGVVLSPDTVVLTWLGATASLSVAVHNTDGTINSAPGLTWSSLNGNIVQVSDMGVLTAKGAGVALIVATAACCGQADTTHARVQQVVDSVVLDPVSVSLAAGATVQLTPRALDRGGSLVEGASFTWSSDNVGVVTVSPAGVISAVGPGTTQVRATSESESGSATVTVAGSTPAPPASPSTVQLRVQRLDGGSGTVLVSSGVPMLPGQFREGMSARLTDQNGEVAAYITPLHGRHRDGSVVSLLVQAEARGGDLLTLELGTAQSRTRSAVPVDFRPAASPGNPGGIGYPAAVWEPPVAHRVAWLSAAMGPTASVAEASARGGAFAAFESDWMTWQDRKWQDYLSGAPNNWDAYAGRNYYDRGMHHMAWWLRGAPVEVFRRGAAYTFGNRYYYYERNNWGIAQPRMWHTESMALHYWLTGDPVSREGVQRFAVRAWGNGAGWNYTKLRYCEYEGEGRPMARSLQAIVWAARMGYTDTDWRDVARRYVDAMLGAETYVKDAASYKYGAWDYLHPDYPSGAGCSKKYVSNFMQAMVVDALITYYEHVNPGDGRIPGVVQRNLDYLRNSQWRNESPSPSFNYYDTNIGGSGGPDASVDLNGFFVHLFAWYAQRSGGGAYSNVADQLFQTLSKNPKDGRAAPWLSGDKQFSETYWKAWQYSGFAR